MPVAYVEGAAPQAEAGTAAPVVSLYSDSSLSGRADLQVSTQEDGRYSTLQARLETLQQAGLTRTLRERGLGLDGRPVRVSLCSNDYLGLAQDPRVLAGAEASLRKYGAGSGSARLLAGELPCHRALEEALAEWLGYPAALLFNSGYHANMGLFPVLPGKGGRILSDTLNHASIIDGCRLSGAEVVKVAHGSIPDLEAVLPVGPSERLTVVVTEGVFSMDGDVAPVEALAALSRSRGALLVVDDAHGLGALGRQGRGVAAPHADVLVGTFGKAFGSAGAFVAGPRVVRDALINLARPFVFTTGPSPAAVGAAHAALEIFLQDPEPQARLARNVAFMRRELPHTGFTVAEGAGHIVPLPIGRAEDAVEFSRRLLARGVDLRAVRPPTVPEGTSRLRLSLSASHTLDGLAFALDALRAVRRELGWRCG